MVSHPAQLSAFDVLTRIDTELQRCRDLLQRIEEEVLPLVSHPIAPTLRAALQDIDLLSQCMDDISRCVSGVADQFDRALVLEVSDIFGKIRLQDMRLRLEGGHYDSRKLTQKEEVFDQMPQTNSGAAMLF